MSEDIYLIRKSEIDAMNGTQKVHFLTPQVRCLSKALGDPTGLTSLGISITETQPGDDTTAHHLHFSEDECVYILEGEATAMIGDESFAVSAGDFLGYRKGGQAHSITNTGSSVLKCLVAGQRVESDVVDYPKQEKRMFRAKGLPWKVVDWRNLTDRLTGKRG